MKGQFSLPCGRPDLGAEQTGVDKAMAGQAGTCTHETGARAGRVAPLGAVHCTGLVLQATCTSRQPPPSVQARRAGRASEQARQGTSRQAAPTSCAGAVHVLQTDRTCWGHHLTTNSQTAPSPPKARPDTTLSQHHHHLHSPHTPPTPPIDTAPHPPLTLLRANNGVSFALLCTARASLFSQSRPLSSPPRPIILSDLGPVQASNYSAISTTRALESRRSPQTEQRNTTKQPSATYSKVRVVIQPAC